MVAYTMSSEAEILPTSLVSKVVVDAAVAAHVFRPGDDPHPTFYYLNLQSIGWVEIGHGRGGWGLAWRLCAVPEETDMQEYGKVIILSLRESAPFASFVGNAIQKVESVVLPQSPLPIGVSVTWAGGSMLIYNWGDEVYVSESWPEYLREAGARISPEH